MVQLTTADVIEHERTDYLRVLGASQGGGAKGRQGTAGSLAGLDGEAAAPVHQEPTSDRVFLSRRRTSRSGEYEPLHVSGLEQMVRELPRQAGITRRVWPQMFRHTYITFLFQQGVDSTKIRRVVGRSSTQLIDRVYGHLLERDLADSVLAALTRMPDYG
jgi:integrase